MTKDEYTQIVISDLALRAGWTPKSFADIIKDEELCQERVNFWNKMVYLADGGSEEEWDKAHKK